MKICGSCFRHQSPAKRLDFLKNLETNQSNSKAGWCPTCGLPMKLETDWSPEAIQLAIRTTEANL